MVSFDLLQGTMENAVNTIENLLKEGNDLVKLSFDRSNEVILDSQGKRANYSSLVERVNGLGSALAQVKSEIEEFNIEKAELLKMVEKLENADLMEIQKLAAIINKL